MVVSESKFCRNKITGNKDIFVLSLGKIYGLLIQDFCKFSDRVSQLDQLPHLLYSDFCDISCVLWRLLVEKSKLSGKFPSHDVVTASSYSSSKVHQTWQHAPVWSHRASGASWKPLHECVAVGCFQKSRGESTAGRYINQLWKVQRSWHGILVIFVQSVIDVPSAFKKILAILGLQNVENVHQCWPMHTASYVTLAASTSCKSRAINHIYHLIK